MLHQPFSIKSRRVALPDGIRPGIIMVRSGKIENILPYDAHTEGNHQVDAGDALLSAGFIDCHVHLNEPGRADWEGFDSGTRAAAAGGITTLVDMPLNSSPVTTDEIRFRQKIQSSAGKLQVNCGFWGGVIPGNANEIEKLLSAGTLGLKAFLSHSGIDEFPNSHEDNLRAALQILKKHNKPFFVIASQFVDHPVKLSRSLCITYIGIHTDKF